MRKRPTNTAATGRSASAERPSPSGLSTLGDLAGATPSGVALVSTCQAYVCVCLDGTGRRWWPAAAWAHLCVLRGRGLWRVRYNSYHFRTHCDTNLLGGR